MTRVSQLGGAVATFALALALWPGPAVRAECAESWYVPTLVTDTGVVMPEAPTLVLLAVPDFRHEAYRAGPFANGFALTRRGHRVPLVVEELGLGIARLQPAAPLTPGLWRMEGLPTAASINIARDARLPPPPAAPEGVSLTMPRERSQAATSETARSVVAFFEPETPRSAILLGYWDDTLGAAAQVRDRDERVTLFRPTRCNSFHPDARPPAAGGTRELAWLDGFGRVSPRLPIP